MRSEVDFRFAGEDDMPELLALFSRAFPGRAMSAAYYQWQFFENPIYPFSSVVAEHNGRIVAHVGYSGREALIDGRQSALFVKPTSMSDPIVRGCGVYSRLLSWAKEPLATRGAELVLSYPNANNHPVQITHPNYTDIWQIPALVRPARKFRETDRSLGVSEVGTHSRFVTRSADLEYIGNATLGTQGFGIMRTARYLEWRYGKRPDTEYFMCEDRQGGRLRSALIWKYYPASKPDRIMVVEWLSGPEDPQAAQIFELVEALADAKGLAVYTWQNVHAKVRHKLLERRGYTLDTPIVYFGAFTLAEPQRLGAFSDYRLWHVAMGDVDVF